MAKYEFKVGDRVRIRQWEDMEKEFGIDKDGAIECPARYFTKHMRHLCGRTATINDINLRNYDFDLDFDNKSGYTQFYYVPNMLEPVLPDEFVVHCRTQEEVDKLKKLFQDSYHIFENWGKYGTECKMYDSFCFCHGELYGYCYLSFYEQNQDEYGKIYTYPEIAELMGETTEEELEVTIPLDSCEPIWKKYTILKEDENMNLFDTLPLERTFDYV